MKVFSTRDQDLFPSKPDLRDIAAYYAIMENVARNVLKQTVDPLDFANIKSLTTAASQDIKDSNLYEDVKAQLRFNDCPASDLRLLKISLQVAFGAKPSAQLGHAFTTENLARQRFDDDQKSDLTLAIAYGHLMAACQETPTAPHLIMDNVESILEQTLDPAYSFIMRSLVVEAPQKIKDQNLFWDAKTLCQSEECLESNWRLLSISFQIAFGANPSSNLAEGIKTYAYERYGEKSDLTLAIANGRLMAACRSLSVALQSNYEKIASIIEPVGQNMSLESLNRK